jgi:hypothetical protein
MMKSRTSARTSLARLGSFLAITAVLAATVIPVAEARTASYPIPRKDLRKLTSLCVRAISSVGATVRNVNYTSRQVRCSFRVTDGSTVRIIVTRPTYCSVRLRLYIHGSLDSQARLPFYC